MKYILITGATSGIGFEMAKILAEKGKNLFLASRNQEKLNKIKSDFEKKYNISIEILSVDLSKANSAKLVFEFAENNIMNIDALINNSGIGIYGEHAELDYDKVSAMLQLNIISLTELCKLFGAKMKAERSGKILNIASAAAYQPTPYFAAYGASKSYVLNFSEALAKEMEDYNVTVSCLSFGAIATGFYDEMDKNKMKDSHLIKNMKTSASNVAKVGIDTMEKGKLSVIVGTIDKLRTFSARFAPRSAVASISKKVMKSQ